MEIIFIPNECNIHALRGQKVETLHIKPEGKYSYQYILEFKNGNESSSVKDKGNLLSNRTVVNELKLNCYYQQIQFSW